MNKELIDKMVQLAKDHTIYINTDTQIDSFQKYMSGVYMGFEKIWHNFLTKYSFRIKTE